jgi:hypothetical protein
LAAQFSDFLGGELNDRFTLHPLGFATSLGFVAMPWPYFLFLLSAILLYMFLATFAKDLYRRRYQEVL